MNRKTIVFLAVFLGFVALDQATKIWIYTNLAYNRDEIQVIPGLLSIVHAQNPGAAFGMFRGFEHRTGLFLAFVAVAVGVIVDLWRKLPANDWYLSTTFGLILSGAVGNGIDRIHKGTVTDFVRVYTEHPTASRWLIDNFGTSEWPSFNVADVALVVGVILFILHNLVVGDAESAEHPIETPSQA